jgi:hypothetical protein
MIYFEKGPDSGEGCAVELWAISELHRGGMDPLMCHDEAVGGSPRGRAHPYGWVEAARRGRD